MSETQNAPELTPIYDRLHAAGAYHPFTADTFTDWASEAGDIVQISRDGTVYEAPVHKQKIVWKGHPKVTMEATGAKEREAVEKMSNRKYASGGGGRSYARNATGKTWVFEANEEHLYYQINDPDEGILAQLSVTETNLETLFAKTGVNALGQEETLYSRIVQNAGNISAEVTRASAAEGTLTSNLNIQAGKISQIITAVGSNGQVTAASIILAINGSGSTATINADKIALNGNTTIANIMEVDGQSVYIRRPLYVGGTGNYVSINGNNITLAGSGAQILFNGATGGTINASEVSGYIKSASVSGNVLTLTRVDGTSVTFSKATVLTPSWSSGGEYSVVATQNGVDVGRESITPSILISGSGQGTTATVNIATTDGSQWTTHGVTRNLYLEQDGTTVSLKERLSANPTTYASLPVTAALTMLTATANDTYMPPAGYVGFSKVTVDVQGSSGTDVKARFNASSGSYYIEAYENPSSPTPIAGSSKNYRMMMNTGRTQVEIQDLSGARIQNTPVATLSMNTGTLENGSRTITPMVNGQSTAYSYTCTDYLTGSYAVTLGAVTYGSYSGSELPSSRTMTIRTSGRKNPSGAAAEDTNTLAMVMNNGSWVTDPTSANYNKIPVYTNIDDDNIMMKWIDASSVYSRGQTDLINAGGAVERNTNTGSTPVTLNQYVTTLKVNVPTNPAVNEIRFAQASGGAYIVGAYDASENLLANKPYSMQAVADTSTSGAYIELHDANNNRITTAPRARIDVNHGAWNTTTHKMNVYGQVDSTILITKEIDASDVYSQGQTDLINAGGAIERNTNTGTTPVTLNQYVTTLKVNVPTSTVSEVRFAQASGGAYIIGAYDGSGNLLANKPYSMQTVADTSTNGAYIELHDANNNRITTAPRARLDVNNGAWTSDHKINVYGQVNSAIVITKTINASSIYQAGYEDLTLITPDAAFNHAGNYYNAVLKKGSTTMKTLPASSSSQKGMYIPLYDNYTFTSNTSGATPPSGYVGFRSVTVNCTTHNNPITLNRGAYHEQSHTYTWTVELGTNITGTSATTFRVYY